MSFYDLGQSNGWGDQGNWRAPSGQGYGPNPGWGAPQTVGAGVGLPSGGSLGYAPVPKIAGQSATDTSLPMQANPQSMPDMQSNVTASPSVLGMAQTLNTPSSTGPEMPQGQSILPQTGAMQPPPMQMDWRKPGIFGQGGGITGQGGGSPFTM